LNTIEAEAAAFAGFDGHLAFQIRDMRVEHHGRDDTILSLCIASKGRAGKAKNSQEDVLSHRIPQYEIR
jgi:hypothetical protein